MKRSREYNRDGSLKLIHLESHGIPFRTDHNYSDIGELIERVIIKDTKR